MTRKAFSKDGPPDFLIRPIDTDIEFFVQRSALIEASDVWKSMFEICEVPEGGWEDIGQSNGLTPPPVSMNMPESPETLELLLQLVHSPPNPLPPIKQLLDEQERKKTTDTLPLGPIDLPAAIPLPVLPSLYRTADKYNLIPSFIDTLHSHLAAHVLTQPLKVYAMAMSMELKELAAYASSQLLSPPLHTYQASELAILPSIESLHLLYLLHYHRAQKLREVLAGESLFPHGYGKCESRGHADRAEEAWRSRKRYLLSMNRIEAGTNVAKEMSGVIDSLDNCPSCIKAFNAAIDMLEYKCRKCPRNINKIPTTVP